MKPEGLDLKTGKGNQNQQPARTPGLKHSLHYIKNSEGHFHQTCNSRSQLSHYPAMLAKSGSQRVVASPMNARGSLASIRSSPDTFPLAFLGLTRV